jgi:starch synthase
LIGMVMNEPDSQGADLFLRAWQDLRHRAQWLIVGKSGHQSTIWRNLGPDGAGKVAFCSWSSTTHLHRFHAGCDMLLMPSRVEPCGLHQFYAMRYGSVPLVRYCGGLRDSVRPFGESEIATGFRFFAYEPPELIRTVDQAISIWQHQPETWRSLIENGMEADFSWNETAGQYIELYRRLIRQG